MQRWSILFTLFAGFVLATPSFGQENYDAQWIWYDEGNPADSAPAGDVWFRHEVRADEPSTGSARVVADDAFTLWVNGQKIGTGEGDKLYRFNLNGIVDRGPNVVAVQVNNKDGRAGLFVDGEVRGQSGRPIPFDSGAEWVATRQKPSGDAWINSKFAADGWNKVKVIGPHAESPWNALELKDSYLDRYSLAQGFEIERVAEPDLVGSIVAITWGNRGRLIASVERGPILSVIDDNNDGKFDRVVEFSNKIKNCQGLCMVGNDLYAVGDGPSDTGLYKLPDENQDDVADGIEQIAKQKGNMGEHGPHDVVLGPDGWLYHNLGNHAWITSTPESTTSVRNYREDYLLEPAFEDARGHAVGIKAPGGTIWRFTPDGSQWWCETAGFRNHYDFGFNSLGDMFTFDSDMEWDVGAPWYRPVRVNHCIPGAEFGWRSGAKNWPEYYFDSLPTTADIGRGSPTGIVFYEHTQFPEKYRGSLLVCDWSVGRIIAVHLEPNGATYKGKIENLVTGNPLNVSDIEVDRDGTMIFSTGGRNTEGGIYRVTYTDTAAKVAEAKDIGQLLDLPQFQSAWAREIAAGVKEHSSADDWKDRLEQAAIEGTPTQQIRALTLLAQLGPKPSTDLLVKAAADDDAQVRAFAALLLGERAEQSLRSVFVRLLMDKDPTVQRRACEAFVRSGIEPPASVADLLNSPDRWLRFAARLALERVPVEKWKDQALASNNPNVVTHAALALRRTVPDQFGAAEQLKVISDLLRNGRGGLTNATYLDVLRLLQLAIIDGAGADAARELGPQLLSAFPTGDQILDTELSRIICYIHLDGAVPEIMTALQKEKSQAQQIHYALTLRYADVGWNYELKSQLLDWYEQTRGWEGGHSLTPYIANIVGATLERFSPEERRRYIENWAQRPFAAGLLIEHSQPDQIAGYSEVIGSILSTNDGKSDPGREELVALAIKALGKSQDEGSRELLRTFYEQNPDRRDQIARAIADDPKEEDWQVLVRTLQFGDPTTLQLSLRALRKLDHKPEKAEDVRQVILAGLRLQGSGGVIASAVLKKWSGGDRDFGTDVAGAMAHYQKWYSEQYPDAPAAELPQAEATELKYSLEQLAEFLENDPRSQAGDVERGRAVFTKAKCIKCHRFLNEGETIGPDLTSVRRRFQRKEIIESLVHPSQVISDQYRMETIVTDEGLVHNGMPIQGVGGNGKVVLLLSDATRLEIPTSKIDERAKSKVSVMPAGLLNDLTLEDVADLFSFLETSKFNPETPAQPVSVGSGQ